MCTIFIDRNYIDDKLYKLPRLDQLENSLLYFHLLFMMSIN